MPNRFNFYIMKHIGILLAASAIIIAACDNSLPSYEDVHGKPSGGTENSGNEGKDEDKPNEGTTPEVPTFSFAVSPTGTGAYTDDVLTLTFKNKPELGNEGKITIFNADGTQADIIDMADVAVSFQQMTNNSLNTTTIDFIGAPSLKRFRAINYKPVKVEGNSIIIRPHSNRLEYGKTYYVTIDPSAITAEGFSGISADKKWEFATKQQPSSKETVTVAKTGNSDFRTIQAAIDWAYKCGPNAPMLINIRDGIYEEQLFIRSNNKLTFKGESRDGTIIQYANAEEYANGVGGSISAIPAAGESIGESGGRAVILMEICKDIRFENMTLKNTYGKPGQAEVIYNNSDGDYTLSFVNCSLISLQDTFNSKGYGWMKDCLIEGDCDFIWGSPRTWLFEDCEIRAAGDGYIVQARCQDKKYKGFVFLNCSLTKTSGTADGTMYLARSSGADEYYDNVAYINCRMSPVINAKGWYASPTPNPANADASSGWKEYGSKDLSGKSLSLNSRNTCAYTLKDEEYESYYKDRGIIFADAPVGTDWLK